MNDVLKREYSEEFDKLRKSRVEVSYYKYGKARDNFGAGRVDAIHIITILISCAITKDF